MKKVTLMTLTFIMAMSMIACSKSNENDGSNGKPQTIQMLKGTWLYESINDKKTCFLSLSDDDTFAHECQIVEKTESGTGTYSYNEGEESNLLTTI